MTTISSSRYILIFILCTFLQYNVSSQSIPFPLTYLCKETKSVLSIDGKLDEVDWEKAPWTSLFVDIEGSKKPKPRYETKAKLLYNNEFLYVGITMEEPHIWANLKEKNLPVFRYDNDIEVFIDPNGDHNNYYELEVNAINTIWELSLPKPYKVFGKPKDPDNMEGMQSAIHVEGTLNDATDVDTSWTIEIAFPLEGFKKYDVINLPPKEGEYWRINFSRVQWQHILQEGKYNKLPDSKENNWVWSPQHEVNMHSPEKWGFLIFGNDTNKLKREKDWRIKYYLSELILELKHNNVKFEEAESLIKNDQTQLKILQLEFKSIISNQIMTFIAKDDNLIYFATSGMRIWSTKL